MEHEARTILSLPEVQELLLQVYQTHEARRPRGKRQRVEWEEQGTALLEAYHALKKLQVVEAALMLLSLSNAPRSTIGEEMLRIVGGEWHVEALERLNEARARLGLEPLAWHGEHLGLESAEQGSVE